MDKIKSQLQMYARNPDISTKHRPDFNKNSYISIQDRVNNIPEFEEAYMDKLISEGWYKLANNADILSPEMRGRHFKYRLNGTSLSNADKGTFRSGGMVVGKNDENNNYVMYKAYNGCLFPLQISDIQEIYIKNPNEKIEGAKKEKVIKKTVWFNRPEKVTPFPVTLVSPKTGKPVIIYYGKDKYAQERFQMTKKYEYAFRTGDWELF
tara:strand:- start:2016 stop:2639 length:624 start_codon:yes stop_codon:yes gene_type:complete